MKIFETLISDHKGRIQILLNENKYLQVSIVEDYLLINILNDNRPTDVCLISMENFDLSSMTGRSSMVSDCSITTAILAMIFEKIVKKMFTF